MSNLYMKAVMHVAGTMRAQLECIERHKGCIERVDQLAATLRSKGFDAHAVIDSRGSMSMHIFAGGEQGAIEQAIADTGHSVIHLDHEHAMISPPQHLINALPVALTFK